jgi:hypothetical protein
MRSLLASRLSIGYRGKPTGPARGPARRSASPVGCSLAERRACKLKGPLWEISGPYFALGLRRWK